MSDLITRPAESLEVVEEIQHLVEVTDHPPVLITEQQVAFSTAAAAALPRTKPAHGLVASIRAMLASHARDVVSAEDHVPPRHYPGRREAFLEDAAMAREMRRL
ncbi:hypothetical protein AU193_19320 [Mycobacterium sp. GA-1285]|uniref:hypothetical protein n=1 Tax=Mycobacterium sp. GA-1285 TaxID=1772282 RepID=UPI000749C346|nr:hypothetical protein [Mycobacterium sp. GA-1285]KUI11551.1 hypothetical protein AU193_19320 [Mycobacterium sp. GA-1285]